MQPCNRIYYFKIYWRLNMFWAAYRSSSGAPNRICSLWFIYPCGDWPTQPGQRPVTTWIFKQEAANTVWSSWWWAVRRSKHVEPSINFGIINSITRLHLVGYSTDWHWLSWQVSWFSSEFPSEIAVEHQLCPKLLFTGHNAMKDMQHKILALA